METIIDNYKEHGLHRGNTIKYQDTCSTCYSERRNATKTSSEQSPRSVDFDLQAERSEHNSNNYW